MRGKVLLGWLTRDNAVAYLQKTCVFIPPLTTEQGEALWAEKNAAVRALEVRPAPALVEQRMSFEEREAGNRFLNFYRRSPGGLGVIQRVVKVDPRALLCRQWDVNLDKANGYAANIGAATNRAMRNAVLRGAAP